MVCIKPGGTKTGQEKWNREERVTAIPPKHRRIKCEAGCEHSQIGLIKMTGGRRKRKKVKTTRQQQPEKKDREVSLGVEQQNATLKVHRGRRYRKGEIVISPGEGTRRVGAPEC